MSNYEAWMMIFLLLSSAQEQGKEFSFSDILAQEKADAFVRNNCRSYCTGH